MALEKRKRREFSSPTLWPPCNCTAVTVQECTPLGNQRRVAEMKMGTQKSKLVVAMVTEVKL